MSRPAEVLEMAGVGHRITHEDDLPPPRTLLATVVKTMSTSPTASGAMTAVAVGRTLTVEALGELEGEDPGAAPDPCGALEVGSENTFVGPTRRPVVVVDEDVNVPCEDHSDGPIVTGALTVFVNGKPVARRTDELDCGAFIGEGEPKVLVGAASVERAEPRSNGNFGRTRGLGPLVGKEMLATSEGVGPKLGRALAGAEDRVLVPQRTAARAPSGVHVGRLLTQRSTAPLLRMLSR